MIEIDGEIVNFCGHCIEYASDLQGMSSSKYKKTDSKWKILTREVLTRSHEQMVVYHRAIFCLSKNGWAITTNPLLRTMLEVFVNCIVVTKEDNEFRAFKYLSFEPLKMNTDDLETRIKVLKEIEKELIPNLVDEDKKRANEFLSESKLGLYWYQGIYSGPRDVIKKEAPILLDHYQIGGSASHGGLIGYKIFDSDWHREDINPRTDIYPANLSIMASARYLLEYNGLRDNFEDLGQIKRYQYLLKKIGELKKLSEKNDSEDTI